MGAKMYGHRTGKADNDNAKPAQAKHNEVPIKFEDRRTAPVIEEASGRGWYCLVTAPQNEYACADALSDLSIATYVPTNTYWQKRRKGKELQNTEIQAPLFRGYVFACMSQPDWKDDPSRPGERYATLRDDWNPIFEKDAWKRSRYGILRVLGFDGVPTPMPVAVSGQGGQREGLASLADEEREGWFDERKRPALVAHREKRAAEIAQLQAMRPVAKGEQVHVIEGPFAGITAQALNDNDERGRFKILHEMMGAMRLIELSLDDVENLVRPMRPENVALRRA